MVGVEVGDSDLLIDVREHQHDGRTRRRLRSETPPSLRLMTEPKEPITLYGSKVARFRERRDQLEDEHGVQLTSPAVVFELIKQWDGPN